MIKVSRPILFITGLSGAGISTTLKSLEDIGYEVFDNFPLSQVQSVLNEPGFEDKSVAFGFDSRTRAFDPQSIVTMGQEVGAKLLFLSASNHVLHKRFSETRRVHPMAKDRTVTDGIIIERKWLEIILNDVDRVIDTSDLSLHDLKRKIESDYSLHKGDKRLSVTLMSFGFKYGVPRDMDMMFDVRFLKNPHWVPELKPQTGLDKAVQDYILSDDEAHEFIDKAKDMIDFLLPQYAAEGKSYFTIAIGCTGGKHRSVFVSGELKNHIENLNYPTSIKHRNIDLRVRTH